MIQPGQVYIARDDPTRYAIVERVELNEFGMYIYYRVPVVDCHHDCNLEEDDFLSRYHLYQDIS